MAGQSCETLAETAAVTSQCGMTRTVRGFLGITAITTVPIETVNIVAAVAMAGTAGVIAGVLELASSRFHSNRPFAYLLWPHSAALPL